MQKESKKSTFKKPNPLIYYPVAYLAKLYSRLKFHPEYNLNGMNRIEGPAIIMCSHTSNLDFVVVACGLLPLRPTYIMSNHFFTHPKISKLLKPLHAIPKKMFCADINAVRQILKARDAGNVIIMFPEGRLSCCGHTLGIADGTAELVKKMGVDVYWLRENGVYKALPKWGRAGIRPGKVRIDGDKLISAEDLKSLSVDEIRQMIQQAIDHDDDLVFENEIYKCASPAKGLEGILYKCPACGEEFAMETDEHHIFCRSCGSTWKLDNTYRLTKVDAVTDSKAPTFTHINEWFDWEQSTLRTDLPLETDCLIATPDETGVTNRSAGSGHISVDRDEIHFKGTCFGQPLEFTEKVSTVKAFPASVGDHFDIYHDRVMYNIIPQPEPAMAIKFVQYLDRLSAEAEY